MEVVNDLKVSRIFKMLHPLKFFFRKNGDDNVVNLNI